MKTKPSFSRKNSKKFVIEKIVKTKLLYLHEKNVKKYLVEKIVKSTDSFSRKNSRNFSMFFRITKATIFTATEEETGQ